MLDLIDEQREQVGVAEGTFTFRRAAADPDIPRLVRLINEIEAHDKAGQGTTEEEYRAEFTSLGYDPAQDGWVVEEPGRPDHLIAEGYAFHVLNTARTVVGAQVHPAWRRRGLGGELLRRAVARAAAQGARYADAETFAEHPGEAFLRGAGFAPVTTWVEMRFPTGVQLDAPAWPAGYQVRPYSAVDNVAVLTDALNRGFIGHWENRERPLEEVARRLTRPSVRPEGIFLAFGPAGDVAGVCWADISAQRTARRGEPVGYINTLAVVPEHRRRGLGRALLLTGMRWLRAGGQGAIELDAMGDNDLALPLYHEVGFAVTRRGISYRRYL